MPETKKDLEQTIHDTSTAEPQTEKEGLLANQRNTYTINAAVFAGLCIVDSLAYVHDNSVHRLLVAGAAGAIAVYSGLKSLQP